MPFHSFKLWTSEFLWIFDPIVSFREHLSPNSRLACLLIYVYSLLPLHRRKKKNLFQISLWNLLLPAVQLFGQPGMVRVARGAKALPSQGAFSLDWWTVKYAQSQSTKCSSILFKPMHIWARQWQCIPSDQGHTENYVPFTSFIYEPEFWSMF